MNIKQEAFLYRSEIICALVVGAVSLVISTIPRNTATLPLLLPGIVAIAAIAFYQQNLKKSEVVNKPVWSFALAVLACLLTLVVKGNAAIGLLAIALFLLVRSLLAVWYGRKLNTIILDTPVTMPSESGNDGTPFPPDEVPDGEFFHDQEIRQKLMDALSCAKNEVDIISPWLSRYAVNDKLIGLMEKALQRQVKIKIIYGINGTKDIHKDRSQKSEMIAKELISRFTNYPELFKIQKGNTHEKILLCDDAFYLVGSYNLLSFGGEFGRNTHKEIMLYLENPAHIRKLRKDYFSF